MTYHRTTDERVADNERVADLRWCVSATALLLDIGTADEAARAARALAELAESCAVHWDSRALVQSMKRHPAGGRRG